MQYEQTPSAAINDNNDDTQPSPAGLPRRLLLQGMGAAPVLALMGGCGGAEPAAAEEEAVTAGEALEGGIDKTAEALRSVPRSFNHPCLLYTEDDFKRMREKVGAGAQPWAAGWQALTSSNLAQLGYRSVPMSTVRRGGEGHNCGRFVAEMQRAYQLALRWKISGDTRYADLAVDILNGWSSTMTELTGNADRFLAGGIYGYQWANAAEILRTYPGWAAADVKRFQGWLLKHFYPLSHDFLIKHNGADITNYWANWDLCSVAGIMAIGVFCDRADLVDEAVNYYLNGRGNGTAAHSVYFIHPGFLGQFQESGRDQGHATLCIALAGAICEMAWNLGVDLYGHDNNRFLAGAEYVAKSNLTDRNGQLYDLPFSTYANKQGRGTGVSPAARPLRRPCWESVYNHYVNRKGLSAPWVGAMVEQMRPESGGGGDQPGFGTLTFARDPIAAGAAPSGLVANVSKGRVELSWWGSAHARSYNVKRGPSANGPFTTIAQANEPRTHLDAPGKGLWFYQVTAVGDRGESKPSGAVRAAVYPELLARLPLSAGNGDVAVDTSGRARHGKLRNGAGWGSGRRSGEKALALDGKQGHLVLPDDVLANTSDFTIALWVYCNEVTDWARVFTFCRNDIEYMQLISRTREGCMRFSISRTHWWGEQCIDAPALPAGRWVHVAVTLAGELGRLYVDGNEVGRNPDIELNPYQLGTTSRNWLGRSPYDRDPYFDGRLQDLRICSGALTAAEIKLLGT